MTTFIIVITTIIVWSIFIAIYLLYRKGQWVKNDPFKKLRDEVVKEKELLKDGWVDFDYDYAKMALKKSNIITDKYLIEWINLNYPMMKIDKNNDLCELDYYDMEKFSKWLFEKLQNKIPFCCPVCNGVGKVPNGFYTTLNGDWSTSSITPDKCNSCDGTGMVWGKS